MRFHCEGAFFVWEKATHENKSFDIPCGICYNRGTYIDMIGENVVESLHIGNHLSSAGGYLAMGKEAKELDADVFAFFTRNPRGGKAKEIDPKDVDAFLAFAKKNKIVRLVAHAPYTLNPCAEKDSLRTFARETMADDLKRLEDEFTKKSEEYNAQQATLHDQIKERREKELQDLYTRMQQYYQESRTKLDQAGMEKQQAINEKILKAIKEIGAEGGYLYIFDVSSGIPFINETISVDVTDQVKAKLGIK